MTPSSRSGLIARFAIGAVIVIVLTAVTTAVAGLLGVKQLAADISVSPAIQHARVTIPDPGSPQTILIIGSDHRAGDPFRAANTDTMILVRLDPSSSTINVLSVPRDLQVDIPERGAVVSAKLNSAYSVGGPNLLVRVLEQDVFPELQVNHIVDVNFGGFEALVNAIGCVYTDVDHRYYNNTALTHYSSIDLQPGYQKLCGPSALAFVRFRHTDNDIVRNARQQDFIRWAKDQYGPAQLIGSRDKLLRIFGAHAQTDPDLHKIDGLINLFNLVAFSAGHAIKQIPFPAILPLCAPAPRVVNRFTPQTPCYVTADPAKEQRTFEAFMTPTKAVSSPSGRSATPGGAGNGTFGGAPASGAQPRSLLADRGDGTAQAAALGRIAMPVYFPRLIAAGSMYCSGLTGNCPVEIASLRSYPRAYTIRDQQGKRYPAYRMTLAINPALGQYYGVQGTTWRNPPILARATQTRTVAGRRLALYFSGHKLTLVAWRTPQAVYWISNTLTDGLGNQQMIDIAASLMRAGP